MRKTLLLLLLVPWLANAQTTVNGRIMTGTLATRPLSCSSGDQYNTVDGNGAYLCNPVNNTWQSFFGATLITLPNTIIPFSATPAFNATSTASYSITLTGNVTSSTISGVPVNGILMKLHICQGAGGPWTFAFPANFLNTTTIQTTSCTDETYSYDGTNWSQLTQPSSGGGGGGGSCSSSGAQGTVQAASTAGACQATNIVETGTTATVDDSTTFKGPNPWVNADRYGVRASSSTTTPNIAGITISATGGLNTGTLSTNTCASQANSTCFITGDSVVVFTGGAATGISTPAAPTVTPYNAVGGTNTGVGVASPTGATTYQFALRALDAVQGQSATSAYTVITNGQATLGPVTSSVSSATFSNNIMTVVTSGALSSVSPFATCQVYGMLPASFNYEGPVATISGTTLTFNTTSDTRNGATATATTLGSVTCWNSVHVKGALPAGGDSTTRLMVYGGVGAATDFLGFMTPLAGIGSTDTAALVFDWYGATFSPVVRPFFVAATDPGAATKDSFPTTLTNVSGTTVTFAGNIPSTVVTQTILLDQSTNINTCLVAAAAAGNSTCRLPATSAGFYVLNSQLNIPNLAVLEVQGANGSGGIRANDTIFFQTGNGRIKGLLASSQQVSSFSFQGLPTIDCNNAWPCMEATSRSFLSYLEINMVDGMLGFLQGANAQIPGNDWDHLYWSHGGQGYGAIAFECMGSHASGSGNNAQTFSVMNFNAVQLGLGSMQTPAFIAHGCGNWNFNETFFSGKGRFWRPPSPGISVSLDNLAYSQGNYAPFDSFYNVDGSNIGVNYIQHGQIVFDTTAAPMVAANGGITVNLFSESATPQATGGTLTTGNGTVYLQDGPGGSSGGQNTNLVIGVTGALVADPTLGYGNKGIVKHDADLSIGPMYSVHTRETKPAAPTCVLSAGGSVPVGAQTYFYALVYPDGGQGTNSSLCSVTTTGGNQTVTLTAPVSAGAIGYAFYRGNTLVNYVSGCSVNPSVSNVFVDTFSFTCGVVNPSYPDSGPAGMKGRKVWADLYPLSPNNAQNSLATFSATGQLTSTPCVPVTAGSVCIWNGTQWNLLAGNSGSTQALQENAFGVPSWGTPGAGFPPAGVPNSSGSAWLSSYVAPTGNLVGTGQSNTWTTGVQDFSNVISISPKAGTTAAIPATCGVPNIYFATDATPGQNWYFCTAPNTWTQQLNSGANPPGGAINAFQYQGVGGTFAGVNSPIVNGSYLCGYNVIGSASVAPVCNLQGVPVNSQSASYVLLYSDRASFIRESGTTTSTLTLPQVTGNTAVNYPFVTGNFNSGVETLQANAADKIDGSGTGGTQVIAAGWAGFTYSDSSTAPGNWWTILTPMASAFPTCADTGGNHLNISAAKVFTCGTSASGSGLSDMVLGQVPIAASATSVTSSEALAGAGAAITTGPASSTTLDVAEFTGTGGQIADTGVLFSNVVRKDANNVMGAFLTNFAAGTVQDPTGAGFTAGATSTHGIDSTAKAFHLFVNAADAIAAAEASAITANVMPKAVGATGLLTASSITDNGTTVATTEPLTVGSSPPACAGGGAGPGCFTEGTAPTAAATIDDLHADSTQHALIVNNNNTGEMALTRSACINVTPVTVAANTTSDQNLMTCTLAANLLNVTGRTIHIHAAGIYSTAATSTAQLTAKAKLCTVSGCGSGTVISLVSIQSAALVSVTVSNNNWSLDLYATTQTAGATAAFESHGLFAFDPAAATTGVDSVYGDTNATTVGTIDSTAQLFLQITFAYSAGSTSNSVSQRQSVMEVIN